MTEQTLVNQSNPATSDSAPKKKALGRGLGALISDSFLSVQKNLEREKIVEPGIERKEILGLEEISVSKIKPNRNQPRTVIAEDKLSELADSIREQGILQPVLVKRSGDGYELVCGERRFRAAQKCGLEKIPAIVKEIAEDKLLEWALIENIQRQDLNPIEEAQAYFKLAEDRQLTHEEIAKKVGKDRTTVANSIRLLRLPEEAIKELVEGRIQSGHARALLALPTKEYQIIVLQKILKENLSVRQVEELVASKMRKRRGKRARILTPELSALENKLEAKLGTQVKIFNRKNNTGRLEIQYFSLDDLDRVLAAIGIEKL